MLCPVVGESVFAFAVVVRPLYRQRIQVSAHVLRASILILKNVLGSLPSILGLSKIVFFGWLMSRVCPLSLAMTKDMRWPVLCHSSLFEP